MPSRESASWNEMARTAIIALASSINEKASNGDGASKAHDLFVSRSTFLAASISDMQSTIRATDAKLNALIIIFSLPLARLPDIVGFVGAMYTRTGHSATVLVIVTLILFIWLSAFVIALVALAGTLNPAALIAGVKPQINFFAPGLYRRGWQDLIARPGASTNNTLQEHARPYLAATEDDILCALAFEQMKLAIIRDLKFFRFRIATKLGLSNLVASVILYVIVVLQRN